MAARGDDTPMAARSDDTLVAVTEAELDALWDSVTSTRPQGTSDGEVPPQASSPSSSSSAEACRKRSEAAMRIGVKAGDASFAVDELRELQRDEKRHRILPEDGEWVDEDASDPGARFGPKWRNEELTRKNILENDPNYIFLNLVAGAANAPVERLYDEDSVGEAMRMRISEQQARLAGQEASIEIERLQEVLQGYQAQQADAIYMQGLVAGSQNEPFLAKARVHYRALTKYTAAVRARRERVDLSNMLLGTCASSWIASQMGDLALRVIEAEFNGDDTASIDAVTPQELNALLMWDEEENEERVRDLRATIEEEARIVNEREREEARRSSAAWDVQPFVRDGDVRRTLRGLYTFGWRTDDDRIEKAQTALCVALRRLIVLKYADSADRAAAIENFRLVRSPSTRSGMQSHLQNALALDGTITNGRVDEFRAASWRVWLREAGALVAALETALDLLAEKSSLTSPTEEKRAAPVPVPGRRRARVLDPAQDQPKASIMTITEAEITKHRQRVTAVKGRVTAARNYERENADARPGGILRMAHVVGAQDIGEDLAFQSSTPGRAGTPPAPNSADELAEWANAVGWYENLGGDLFERLDVEFPVGAEARAVARDGADIPMWSTAMERAPPGYTAAMMRLWDRHTPTLASAGAKVDIGVQAAAVAAEPPLPTKQRFRVVPRRLRRAQELRRRLRDVEMPALTASERIVYHTLRGVMPDAEAVQPYDRYREVVNDSLLVVAPRLYEADLAIAADGLEKAVAQRDALIHTTQERVARMLRGEPVVRAVPRVPYEHRRGWVEQPEHSGVVTMTPIVTQAIGAAWMRLQRLAPNITDVVDIEFAQRDPQMRIDFADLVAVEMALVTQRHQKQYMQLGQRTQTVAELASIVQRFRKNYTLSRTPGSGMPPPKRPQPRPGVGAAYVAGVVPTGRGNGILLM